MIVEIIFVLVALFFIYSITKKPSNYPPGLWGFPVFGYIPSPFSAKSFQDRIKELFKQHGDIVLWRFGTMKIVFLKDYKTSKEFMASQPSSNRPNIRSFKFFPDKNTGMASSNGIEWHHNRRFALRLLRDLGMGKSRLVSSVQNEAQELVQALKKTAGKAQPISSALHLSVLNVIWQMVASKRHTEDDPDFELLHNINNKIFNYASKMAIPDCFPWIEYLLPKTVFNWIFSVDVLDELQKSYCKYNMKYIKEHEDLLDVNDPRDYVDHYLIEMKKPKTEENSHMSYDDLITSMVDFHQAGTETTSMIMTWTIYFLASFPEVQKKLQEEVDEVLSGEQLATLEDKPRLSYTEALSYEVHRHASLISPGGIRSLESDISLGGFMIPKDTVVLGLNELFHKDPKYWKEPEQFRPERFLDENGKCILPKDYLLPFGSGKRVCIGETLSKMETMIFVSTLAKNFTFSAPFGKKIDLTPTSGNIIINVPKVQDILITCR